MNEGLNDIKLNNSLLVEMYANSLLSMEEKSPVRSEEEKKPPPPEAKKIEWKILGDYKKNILILVNYEDAVHLPNEALTLLTNMLVACKLSLADVGILNLQHAPSKQFKDIREQFNSSIILLVGLNPQDISLPVNFPQFQVQSFNNITFLYSPSAEIMETDDLLKSKLWVSLRKIFNI
jgi:hypothetical protein